MMKVCGVYTGPTYMRLQGSRSISVERRRNHRRTAHERHNHHPLSASPTFLHAAQVHRPRARPRVQGGGGDGGNGRPASPHPEHQIKTCQHLR